MYDGTDNLLMRFEYADARIPVAMTAGGAKYYLAYDQVGTLKAVSDSSGNVVLKREYDTFGNILSEVTTLPFEMPFGFAGGLHDKDTGLVRFGYRDYDPDTGRWAEKDPILFAGDDTDLYGYCVNDPVNFIDPEGLTKGRKQKISGNHPLVDGIGKQSSEKEIREAIEKVSKALKDPALSKGEKKFLKAWLKVAKRGFKICGALGILLEYFITPCEAEAPELPEDCSEE